MAWVSIVFRAASEAAWDCEVEAAMEMAWAAHAMTMQGCLSSWTALKMPEDAFAPAR